MEESGGSGISLDEAEKNMESEYQYGFLNEVNDGVRVKMRNGQNIAGYPIGIIYIEDVFYPIMPGNVVNACTYPFPVRMIPVKNINCNELFACDDKVQSAIEEACHTLIKEGVRAISGACGFFGNYQRSMSEMFDVPVALSSLVQVSWILATLKPHQKLVILTADAKSITERLMTNCGITKDMEERLIIKDLAVSENFSCVITNLGGWDNSLARADVVGKAIEAVEENSDAAAILLECSDMPPYSSAIQRETGLPVFDFITLIKWLHSAVAQKPYEGFI